MGAENYSRYQQNIIKRFYNNRDDIAFQRAQELVTELYLSEGKKRVKVWDSLAKNLEKLGVPADQIAHLRQQDKPELVANLISQKV
jgi:hypothetical protein